MNTKKISLWILTIAFISAWFYISLASGLSFSSASANPDYICTKEVTGSPCVISSCSAWLTNGTRTCNGTMTTAVSYYLIRTTCESWYSQSSNWGNVGWASGRNSNDYVSWSESCSITEVDNIAPTGTIWE